jgi:predicted metal-binding membrane protein
MFAGAWTAADSGAAPHAAHAPTSSPPAWTAAAGWLAMIAAMMFPLLVDPIRTTAARSLWPRRDRAVALFLAGYLGPWLLAGAIALSAAVLVRQVTSASTAASIAFLLAALWQMAPLKKQALLACHRTMPLAPRGWRADRDCLRYGTHVGLACVVSCAPMMAAAALASHALIPMVGVSVIALVERRAPRLPALFTAAGLAALGLA